MDLIDNIHSLSTEAKKQIDSIHTEEATKTALVMPFINNLGYNVFDATEVIPEFTADHGVKKNEKVDYAICRNGEPIILFECKCVGTDLKDGSHSQLYRYFSVTNAKFAVLTNGIKYRFYTDAEESNKLDDKPFFELDLFDYQESQINELKRFSKEVFDPDEAFSAAVELKQDFRELK